MNMFSFLLGKYPPGIPGLYGEGICNFIKVKPIFHMVLLVNLLEDNLFNLRICKKYEIRNRKHKT